jgi:hypothetical protein
MGTIEFKVIESFKERGHIFRTGQIINAELFNVEKINFLIEEGLIHPIENIIEEVEEDDEDILN